MSPESDWQCFTSWPLYLVFMMALVGCGGGTSSGGGTSTMGGGRLIVQLTDAPTIGVTEVNVYIAGLHAMHTNGTMHVVSSGHGPINLLALQGYAMTLASAQIPSGHYQSIAMHFDPARCHLVEHGLMRSMHFSTHQVTVSGGFDVVAGQTTHVLIDFDANASVTKISSGEWHMHPAVHQVHATMDPGCCANEIPGQSPQGPQHPREPQGPQDPEHHRSPQGSHAPG